MGTRPGASILDPGPFLVAWDGLGLFGPPDPTLIANPAFSKSFVFDPLPVLGIDVVFQLYCIDLSLPFPDSIFASNPVLVRF